MIKKIDRSNLIFWNTEFFKEQFMFPTIMKNLNNNAIEFYSDEKNYIVYIDYNSNDIVIWTKNNFDQSALKEIGLIIDENTSATERQSIICKNELCNLLMQGNYDNLEFDKNFEGLFLKCTNIVNVPKNYEDNLFVPSLYAIPILKELYYNYYKDNPNVEYKSKDQVNSELEQLILDGKIYAWKNKYGKVVSFIVYDSYNVYGKIKNVYTLTEERKRGYASSLIYKMTNIILESGLEPIVDICDGESAKKIYEHIGYKEVNLLKKFSLSKTKKFKK